MPEHPDLAYRAQQILAAHEVGIFVASFFVGQSMLALVLWALRAGWIGVGYWAANGLLAGILFGWMHLHRHQWLSDVPALQAALPDNAQLAQEGEEAGCPPGTQPLARQ